MEKTLQFNPPEFRQRPLTSREREILMYVGQGKNSREIARLLQLSVMTVANHRKSICRKLGIHTTAEMVALGAQLAGGEGDVGG